MVEVKRLILLIVLAVLVVCLGVVNVSCDHNQYVGMYYGVESSGMGGVWLELKSDGTYQTILGVSGTWKVEGNQLTVTYALGYDTYIIEDGKIMDQKGKVLFVKQ
jgi:hypothetical protein